MPFWNWIRCTGKNLANWKYDVIDKNFVGPYFRRFFSSTAEMGKGKRKKEVKVPGTLFSYHHTPCPVVPYTLGYNALALNCNYWCFAPHHRCHKTFISKRKHKTIVVFHGSIASYLHNIVGLYVFYGHRC
jgi:hypothetical protein